eukprot:364719-Chlamydomonas_euryale.AAC.1
MQQQIHEATDSCSNRFMQQQSVSTVVVLGTPAAARLSTAVWESRPQQDCQRPAGKASRSKTVNRHLGKPAAARLSTA